MLLPLVLTPFVPHDQHGNGTMTCLNFFYHVLLISDPAIHPYELLRFRQCMKNNARLQQLGLVDGLVWCKLVLLNTCNLLMVIVNFAIEIFVMLSVFVIVLIDWYIF
jgi:hypothetical protein